jgi:hypothetical protein
VVEKTINRIQGMTFNNYKDKPKLEEMKGYENIEDSTSILEDVYHALK